jgi:hypothetical protein
MPEPKPRASRSKAAAAATVDPMTLLNNPRELAAQVYRRAAARNDVPHATLLDIGVLVGVLAQLAPPDELYALAPHLDPERQ